jgi:hypothetical protein
LLLRTKSRDPGLLFLRELLQFAQSMTILTETRLEFAHLWQFALLLLDALEVLLTLDHSGLFLSKLFCERAHADGTLKFNG